MLAIKNLSNDLTIFRYNTRLMGDSFEISVVGNNPLWAEERINTAINEIKRVEKLLSAFNEDSCINNINRNAGIQPVKVNPEVFRLIDRSIQISALTYGTFDITYQIGNASHNADLKADCTYKSIVLDAQNTSVFLKNKKMRIGFGAVSKGYAADRAKYVLQMLDVSSGVINAGGDLLAWGAQPDYTPWTIAAADPAQVNKPFAHVNISNMAIATSAVFESEDHHTSLSMIDTKTGFPVSVIKSASIIGASAELADAMATPMISMGLNAGLYLINQLHQMACVIVDDQDRIYSSKGLNIN